MLTTRFVVFLVAIERAIHALAGRAKAQQEASERRPPREPLRVSVAEISFSKEVTDRYYIDQKKSHTLQWSTFWLGVLTCLTLTFYAWVTFRQWRTMRDQAALMQDQLGVFNKQLEATDRPWLKVDVQAPQSFRRTGDSLSLVLVITIKNVGKSVATNIETPFRIYPQAWGTDVFQEPIKQQADLCKGRLASGQNPSRLALFPDEQVTEGASGTFALSEAIEISKRTFPKELKYQGALPIIVGCVDYQFVTSPRHHQTGFIYQLIEFKPAFPNAGLFWDLAHMEIPTNEFRLERNFFGGYIAN
jgi:hypothetical protein